MNYPTWEEIQTKAHQAIAAEGYSEEAIAQLRVHVDNLGVALGFARGTPPHPASMLAYAAFTEWRLFQMRDRIEHLENGFVQLDDLLVKMMELGRLGPKGEA